MTTPAAMEKRNRIAQWAFDTRPILGRFHLWLEDVEVTWLRGGTGRRELANDITFVGGALERGFIMATGVAALGTRLFGRFGEGEGKAKQEMNRVKKDADAISAYMLSECLWHITRQLPENHAVMVCLGEGLMPKGWRDSRHGQQPLLGFRRIYARPRVAKLLDRRVQKLINNPDFNWGGLPAPHRSELTSPSGAQPSTRWRTSHFAKGKPTGR
ncbi:MAG: hypothetical protein R3D98_16350 [Candidatus Krumholzibacteriia bacterium]